MPSLSRRAATRRRRCSQRPSEVEQICKDLMGAADHSLRTPLTAIVGYTEILLDGNAGALTGAQEHMVESINTNCTRMVHLTQEVLDDVQRGLSFAAEADRERPQLRVVR